WKESPAHGWPLTYDRPGHVAGRGAPVGAMTARTVEFDLITTLLLSMLVLFVGRWLVAWVPVLARLNVPAPVVGGGVVAVLLALADGLLHVNVGFNLGLKDTLLLMFFT